MLAAAGGERMDGSELAGRRGGVPAITRPHESLMTYYVLASLLAGPFFPFVLLPLYFRYHSMRYRFSEEGVAMQWGVLFRREINLAYARIQDIHLSSNVVERWLGLARIQVQTASGSAGAEMTIEGLREFRAVRDFLYSRMRGARGHGEVASEAAAADRAAPAGREPLAEAVELLAAATAELRAIREALERRSGAARDA